VQKSNFQGLAVGVQKSNFEGLALHIRNLFSVHIPAIDSYVGNIVEVRNCGLKWFLPISESYEQRIAHIKLEQKDKSDWCARASNCGVFIC
jgi:hypothetical protein